MIRKQWIFALLAALTLVSAQRSAIAQYGPPVSGSSAAISFTPATLGLVAGLNGGGYSGDGGLATAAKLDFPDGIAYDSSGNLYIADTDNYVVREVNAAGIISTVAGNNTFPNTYSLAAPPANTLATNWPLGYLDGVAVDSSNNLYMADRTYNVIWKVSSSTGYITIFAGTPVIGGGYTGDGGAATSATLDNPESIAFDLAGNLYVADEANNVVRIIGTNGNINTFAGNGTGAGQYGGCPASFSGGGGAATAATLCGPQGVAADRAGNVYISSYTYDQVYIVGTNGKINLFAGNGVGASSPGETYSGDGGAATSAQLWRPEGLYADPAGNVYIADQFGAFVREVNPAGIISTVFGIPNGGNFNRSIIGISDTEANTSNLGDSDGNNYIAMDAQGNLIVSVTDASTILNAGSTGQYRFPQTPIYTTETTTQANASSIYYPPYVTISNPSGVTLNFTAIPTVTGPFAIVTGTGAGTCVFPGSVAPGQSCTVVLSFTPTAGGSPGTTQTGTVAFTSNANSSATISLSGVGTGVATVSATLGTSPLNFTSPAGVTSAPQTVTLTNTGQLPIALGNYDFNFYNPTNFAVSATTCPSGSATLAVGASCTYSITFTPTTATTYSAGFQACVTTSSYGCLQSIALNGTGTAGATATLLPTPLAFGNVSVGQTSVPISATFSNTSSIAITINGETISGTNPADFAIGTGTNACGSTLAANSSCIVYVTFTPATATSFSAQLSVADTASGSPQTVALSGTGVPSSGPPTVIAPLPLVFDPAAVGTTSPQTLTATFQVNGFSTGFTPTAALHYGLSYSIGAVTCTGPTGALTCSVPVTFQPQYPGGRREALFLMVGSTRLASVLIYGIGQSPFALVQPGLITQPILNSSNYNYTSIVDEDGTVYDIQGGQTIVAVTKTGVATTLPITGLNSARSVGIDGAGILYIADQKPTGPTTTYDTVQGIQGSIAFPSGPFYVQSLAVGNTGNLFETDGTNVYTLPVSGTGTAATVAINPAITQGFILASDSSDDIFVSGYTINELPAGGGTQTEINTNGAGDGLGVDAAATVYATRYSPTGGVAELPASGYGTAIGALDTGISPLGASVGPDGTVYVGNYNNLDKVDRSQGAIAFGSIGATASQNASIYNGGNQPLTITSIATAGAGFSWAPASTNPCELNTPIPAGAICQVTVTLTASHAGFYSGTLTYTDNSLNSASSTQTVALSGEEYGIYVVASPTSLNFGNQAIGTSSAPQVVTLTNYGDSYSATIAAINSSGPFIVSNNTCTSPLAPATSVTSPGASCQFSLSFAPTTTATYNGTSIGLAATSPGFPAVSFGITVSGTGTAAAAPIATLSPNYLIFPNTTAGTTSAPLQATLSNTGTAALTGITPSLAGGFVSQFAISSTTCTPTLAPSSSCLINITFTPGTASSFSTSLSVADNAAVSPQTLAISGAGVAGTPSLTLSPTSLTFPSTTVGVAATSLPVTVSNPGTAAVTITSVLVSNTSAGFTETNTCGGSIAAGGSCIMTVSFTPTAAGAFAGSISFSDSAASSPQTVTLAGTGAAVLVPQATLAPSSLTFSSTTVGVAAATQPITLSNPGTGALTISGISVTGANASSFAQTNNCGSSLAAGASCMITVGFTPGAVGSLAAAILVADNGSGSPQSVAISGTGVAGTATFTVSSSTPSASVQPGGVAQFNLVIAPVGGSYINVVTLSATGLPAGAQASFMPPSVTPGSAGAPSVLSIQTATGLARLAAPERRGQSSVPMLALLAGLPLLGFAGVSRKLRKSAGRWILLGFAVLSVLPLLALSGCGGGYFGPAPKTYTVTVVGTSGALQQSTTISLTVQ